jgi:5'-deoxynucleotidase YfbR-like HD superfamily hydrolase
MQTSDTFLHALSLRASGYVKRWHTIHTMREQSVASHSGQAVSLLLCLHPSPSLNLIKAVLWHDCSERVVGDAPSPGLRAFPEYRRMYEQLEMVVALRDHPSMYDAIVALNDDERQWLRAIDVLEAFLFSQEEVKLGNSQFSVVTGRLYDALNMEGTPAPVIAFRDWYLPEGRDRSFA